MIKLKEKYILLVFLTSFLYPLSLSAQCVASAATDITQTSFTANWSPTAAPSYHLLVATDASFNNIVPGYNNLNVGLVTSYSVTGLNANTMYYYKVGILAMVAPFIYGNTITLRTGPNNPTALAATDITISGAKLNWNSVENAVYYEIMYAKDVNFSVCVGTTDSEGGTSKSLSDLSSGTQYWYKLKATNSYGGVSEYSNVVTFTTESIAPSAPVANPATFIAQNEFTANWNAVGGADGYYLDVATDNLFQFPLDGYTGLNVGNVTSYTVSGLSANTDYYYRLQTFKGLVKSGYSDVISLTTLPDAPNAPVTAPADPIERTSFFANWNASEGAAGYYLNVYTDNGLGTNLTGYNNLDVGNVTTWQVLGLAPNTTYYYTVKAFNYGGESGPSDVITVTTLPDVPSVPEALAATIIDNNSFSANWNASSGVVTGYLLDVATDEGFTHFLSGFEGKNVGNVNTFTVAGINYNTNYFYRIRAYNAGGESGNSISITVFIPVSIESDPVPENYYLYQNYPNPFNPSTIIKFNLRKSSYVSIIVYDVSGREVATLTKGNYAGGAHSVRFNAANLANGIYFYRIITNEFSDIKKMILMK